MSDLDIQIPTAFDPFGVANAEDSGAGTKDYVHVRIQQRNGRKSLTTVRGLKKEFSYNKILKDLKKDFCCNGTVVQDPELGQGIQLQGDQRKNVSAFFVQGPHLLAPTGNNHKCHGHEGTVFSGYHYDLNFLTIYKRSRFPGLNILVEKWREGSDYGSYWLPSHPEWKTGKEKCFFLLLSIANSLG